MHYFIIVYLLLATSAKINAQSGVKIAFLADVHLQDIYGTLNDNSYKGIINPVDGMPVLIRTMESQLHSTRIFNENYFAFIAALDDIAARGIKIVALPGDYTDDGQPIHLRGLQHILKMYEDKYSISFFITTGNHDPVGPFAKHAGKTDFLGAGGKQQPIFSKETMYKPSANDLPVVVTSDIACMGYTGITEYLGSFGFM
ncbi:MAG: metallophosphoesterase, partial [Bacteroidota bacterium]